MERFKVYADRRQRHGGSRREREPTKTNIQKKKKKTKGNLTADKLFKTNLSLNGGTLYRQIKWLSETRRLLNKNPTSRARLPPYELFPEESVPDTPKQYR